MLLGNGFSFMGNGKTTKKVKEPVRLREKKLANGNISLYLDIYRDGKREYEFLRLYLYKCKNSIGEKAEPGNSCNSFSY